MLQIKDIHKEYRTGNLVQRALDGVSLSLQDNEFVAILGPSGFWQDHPFEYYRWPGPLRQRRPDHQWNFHQEI